MADCLTLKGEKQLNAQTLIKLFMHSLLCQGCKQGLNTFLPMHQTYVESAEVLASMPVSPVSYFESLKWLLFFIYAVSSGVF